ncbi:AraC-like DNA-binding protein [Enterobacter sp. BIGb0383]|uniref:AraC family transcriptional regulator n=1 Tax=unclassified Enterobacter TaxID=2608935 RepID=UPI000F499455|nr:MULTISPECIES: AraC family transcriptional regulator [unclassified Enterobacter]ROP59950.1 AraC-like DNA-binding protein [Enterobacter sp. BIGb0383]ROS08581.1 AraC-like DNA-binding protein [Enterobacter sp. BIGb0359]
MPTPRTVPQTFWRSPRLPWVELRSTWQSRQAYKRHTHPQLSLGAIVEGGTRCVCDGQEYLLEPGDLIVIAPDAPHSCNPIAGRPRSYHMLWLDKAWCLSHLPELAAGGSLSCPQPVVRDPQRFHQVIQLVEQLYRGEEQAVTQPLIDLLQALPLQSEPLGTMRSTSQKLSERLLTNLAAPPTLDALAAEFCLRKETLIRTFKQDTGLTPGSFLNMARIEQARARLRAGDTLADVGYQTGFADQSHFHKTFVNYTAATPRQYATGRSISDNK